MFESSYLKSSFFIQFLVFLVSQIIALDAFAAQLKLSLTFNNGNQVHWLVDPLREENDSISFQKKGEAEQLLTGAVTLSEFTVSSQTAQEIAKLNFENRTSPIIHTLSPEKVTGASYRMSHVSKQHLIHNNGILTVLNGNGILDQENWQMRAIQLHEQKYELDSIDSNNLEIKGVYLTRSSKTLKISDQPADLSTLNAEKISYRDSVIFPSLAKAVNLVNFSLVDSASTPLICHNQECYLLESFESERDKGTFLTRVRDSEVLKVSTKVISEIGSKKFEIQNGILTLPSIFRKIDLDRFDAELNFPAAASSDPVLAGTPHPLMPNGFASPFQEVNLYRELVGQAYKEANLQSFYQKQNYSREIADPEITGKIARSLRTHRSSILLGDSGTGKTSAIYAFAKEVALGHVPGVPRTLRIFEIKAITLAAGGGQVGEVERRVLNLIAAAQEEGSIVYFLDSLHSFVGLGTHSSNPANSLQSLKGPISQKEFIALAADTEYDFNKAFASDDSFAGLFQKISISKPSNEQLNKILESRVPKKYPWPISEDLFQEAIQLSQEYGLTPVQPKAAVELLNLAFELTRDEQSKYTALTSDHLKQAVQELYGVKAAFFDKGARNALLKHLREGLDEKIVGQAEAKEGIYSIWLTKLTQVGDPDDINSILFVGPPGVGKTATANASAELMGYRTTQIEMNAYAWGGKGIEEFRKAIYEAIKADPFHVIVLDEFEKAHIAVQEGALSMLQSGIFTVNLKPEGSTTDGITRTVSAQQAVFVLSANGTDTISKPILSRLQEVVFASRPNQDDYILGIQRYLKKAISRESADKKVAIILSEADQSSFVQFAGGTYKKDESNFRDVKKLIKKKVEYAIARALVERPSDESKKIALIWEHDHFNFEYR